MPFLTNTKSPKPQGAPLSKVHHIGNVKALVAREVEENFYTTCVIVTVTNPLQTEHVDKPVGRGGA